MSVTAEVRMRAAHLPCREDSVRVPAGQGARSASDAGTVCATGRIAPSSRATSVVAGSVHRRGAGTVRRFSAAEDRGMLRMKAEGASVAAGGRALGDAYVRHPAAHDAGGEERGSREL